MIFCPSGTTGTGSLNGGVTEFCPSPENPARYFTQIIVNGNLVIPPHKPPKSHIVKVTHQVALRDVEVLPVILPGSTTPAGYKIVVSGTLTLYIQYVADVPDQKVHVVHYELPFNGIIMRDCALNTSVFLIPPGDTILPDNFVAHVCVEKLRITQIDSRTLSKEIVLMLWVEQKQP